MSSDPNGLLMPSGQMVSIEDGRVQPDSTVGQTIQQMKRECFLRSEATHGQAGGLKLCLRFCVLSLFAFRLRFLDLISNK